MMKSIPAAAALIGACAALLGACAAGPGEFLRRPEQRVGWPPDEDPPRVEVVWVYHGSADVERDPGFFESLGNLLAGAAEHELVSPYGTALAPNGALLIADSGTGVVHRLSLDTGEHEVFTGTDEVPLETPIGVAVGPLGEFYVTDSTAGRVVVFDEGGDVLFGFGSKAELGRPTGIAFDRERDRLLIVDTTGCRILGYRLDGSRIAAYGKRGEGPGEFNYPTSLALTREGRVVVTDSLNFRIQTLSADLEPLGEFGIAGRGPGTFASPKGVAVDSQGHVWVVDGMFGNVQIFDADGLLLLAICADGAGFGQLALPTAISIDDRGRVFVSDTGNARIQLLQFNKRPAKP